MSKTSEKSNVRKSLVRNICLKNKNTNKLVQHEFDSNSEASKDPTCTVLKENDLSQPTLCSSESLANYMADIKKLLPPPLSSEDLKAEKEKISGEVTKKLNFHLNDRIYNNLVELNASIEELKSKERKVSNRSVTKKDVEPNIEDFFQDNDELDIPPTIPDTKLKFKPLYKKDNGTLHKLVASFDML